MSAEKPAAGDLWNRILDGVAAKVPRGSFDTWFRPLREPRLDDSLLELAVPTETFRDRFAEVYLDLLHGVAAETAGRAIAIRLSIRKSESWQAEGCTQDSRVQPLPVVRAADLQIPACPQPWLIERLWTHQAVGVIGGNPKSGKTWLALEMAVSVASGTPCLDAFPVLSPGPVLVYAAEDSTTALRARLDTLARVHKTDFKKLDVRILTVDSLRLERPEHQDRLASTLHAHKPVLLVLDPMVRVHSIDENVAGQVAALLGYLRSLQRTTGTAIAMAHHLRKNASPAGAAGYSLRGSGDLYAWLDSFLYLRLHQGKRILSAEHRSAPAWGPIHLELVQADAQGAYLRMVQGDLSPPECQEAGLDARVLELLSSAPGPMTVENLRTRLQVRNQRVVETLRHLTAQGKVQRSMRGFSALSPATCPTQMSM